MADYDWQFLPDLNVVELTTNGRITIPGLFTSMSALADDPRWRSDTQMLAHFGTGTVLSEIRPSQLLAHANSFQAWNREHRNSDHPRTALVCHESLALIITSLWTAIRSDKWLVDVKVMASRDKALDWLTTAPAPDTPRPPALADQDD